MWSAVSHPLIRSRPALAQGHTVRRATSAALGSKQSISALPQLLLSYRHFASSFSTSTTSSSSSSSSSSSPSSSTVSPPPPGEFIPAHNHDGPVVGVIKNVPLHLHPDWKPMQKSLPTHLQKKVEAKLAAYADGKDIDTALDKSTNPQETDDNADQLRASNKQHTFFTPGTTTSFPSRPPSFKQGKPNAQSIGFEDDADTPLLKANSPPRPPTPEEVEAQLIAAKKRKRTMAFLGTIYFFTSVLALYHFCGPFRQWWSDNIGKPYREAEEKYRADRRRELGIPADAQFPGGMDMRSGKIVNPRSLELAEPPNIDLATGRLLEDIEKEKKAKPLKEAQSQLNSNKTTSPASPSPSPPSSSSSSSSPSTSTSTSTSTSSSSAHAAPAPTPSSSSSSSPSHPSHSSSKHPTPAKGHHPAPSSTHPSPPPFPTKLSPEALDMLEKNKLLTAEEMLNIIQAFEAIQQLQAATTDEDKRIRAQHAEWKRKEEEEERLRKIGLGSKILNAPLPASVAKKQIDDHESTLSIPISLPTPPFWPNRPTSAAEAEDRILQILAYKSEVSAIFAQMRQNKIAELENTLNKQFRQLHQEADDRFKSQLAQRMKESKEELEKKMEIELLQDLAALTTKIQNDLQKRYTEEINYKLANERERLENATEELLRQQRQEVKEVYDEEMAQRNKKLSDLEDKKANYQTLFNKQKEYRSISAKLHRLTLSVIDLDPVLTRRGSFSKEWNEVRFAAEHDEVIAKALSQVPSQVIEKGVKPLTAIKTDFDSLQRRVRAAALLPNTPTPDIMSEALAQIFSLVTMKEVAAGHQLALAHTNSNVSSNDFNHLSLANYHLSRGDVDQTIRSIQQMNPHVRKELSAWLKDAHDYAIVQSSINTIKSRTETLAQTFAQKEIKGISPESVEKKGGWWWF